MKAISPIIVLLLISALAGCSSQSSWDSPVVRSVDHPQHGLEDFPVGLQVTRHHCGMLRRICTPVRFADETGFNDVFTFIGEPAKVSLAWTDFHHLQISCDACAARNIELQRKEGIYEDNIFITYKI
jgi:hypothetical protein